jgi:hypothetical protein
MPNDQDSKVVILGSVELLPSSNFEKKFAEDLKKEIQEHQKQEKEALKNFSYPVVRWC